MKTKQSGEKRLWRSGNGYVAAAIVGVSLILAGCGGSGSFVDQNGQPVVGRGEPSGDLRAAVARIVTDPAPEVAVTDDKLSVPHALAPLFATSTIPPETKPFYDSKLGLYVYSSPISEGNMLELFADVALTQEAGFVRASNSPAPPGFATSDNTEVEITVGPLAGTKTFVSVARRADQTYQYSYQALNETDSARQISVRTAAESDITGRVTYNGTTEEQNRGRTTLHSVSRVVRNRDRNGERRGVYTFSGDVITVQVTYKPGGTGTGTLTGTANGLPATIGVGDRTTTVIYADGKTLDTFDLPQPTAQTFLDKSSEKEQGAPHSRHALFSILKFGVNAFRRSTCSTTRSRTTFSERSGAGPARQGRPAM